MMVSCKNYEFDSKLMSLNWSEIASNIKNRNFSPFLQRIYKTGFEFLSHSGDNVLEEEWDYLVVLDACRYDFFEEINQIEGKLDKRTSVASTTPEWLEKTFSGNHEDIVYVSANPHVSDTGMESTLNPEDHFSDYYLPFLRKECKEFGVTIPECVSEDARKAINNNPDKKAIIHYMQPHAPYIGDKKLDGSLYNLYSDGVSREELVEAYKSNLRRVLDEVESLVSDLEGKVIVTADHGEMLGEKGVYAHGRGLYLKELVQVPWLEIESKGNQGEKGSENKEVQQNYDEEEIKDQLADLGYGE
jgi:arylsulfatase A-like enzyme